MRIAAVAVIVYSVFMLAACQNDWSSGDGDCTSRYVNIARAPSWKALRSELANDVSPRVESTFVVDRGGSDGRWTVNLLNDRRRVVMSLDAWQEDDGTWVAARWSQCIDS